MRIVVCVKQVPDTTEIKIDPVKNTLIREGVPSIMNPFDKNALEMALQLKDSMGAEVVAISMGPMQAKNVLREAISMGADKAYLVTDRAFGGSDTYATSYILSCAIENLGPFDIVLGGKQAIDGDTGQTASSIAEHLNMNRLSYVTSIEVTGEDVVAHRLVEEGTEVVKTKTPVLCTVIKEANKPRYATIRRKIYSLNVDIPEVTIKDFPDIDTTKIGLKGSPTNVKSTFIPKRTINCIDVVGDTSGEKAKSLFDMLETAKML